MDQIMPQEIIQNHFQTKIQQIDLLHHRQHASYYQATTNYGTMTLIVEKIIFNDHLQVSKGTPFQSKQSHRWKQERLRQRNALIIKGQIITPLIYEQQVKKIRDDYVICMSLCESVRPISVQQIIDSGIQSHHIDMVNNAYKSYKQQFQYALSTYELSNCLQSINTGNIFFDFTSVSIEPFHQQKNTNKFKVFIRHLSSALKASANRSINEIIFNKDSPFILNLQRIEETTDWIDLAFIFNLLPEEKVTVINQSRRKGSVIKKLEGNPKFEYNDVYYERYKFKQGFCTDGIINLTFVDLKERFFEDNKIYEMSKLGYLLVRKLPLNPESLIYMHTKLDYDDIIYVNQEISKVEFINFIIGYMKYIEPIINELHFHHQDNIIQLIFTNKVGKVRKTIIKFYEKYVVKDEELSMIIEKSKIKNAIISLEKMGLTDSFLIFLANCDKALNFRSINLSNCNKFTQSGLQLLLSSPFFKNINVLKIDGLPCSSFRHVKFGLTLKEISLNDAVSEYMDNEMDLSGFALQRISALNYNIALKFQENLKYLKINSYFVADNFKYLKGLSLIELKIKVSQSKKNINNFLSNLNFLASKENGVKIFSEGSSRKTLKLLDISESTIKLRQLKHILCIQSLQTLIADDIQCDKFTDLTLPNHILNLSLKNSTITIDILQRLIQKMNILIKLTIKGTRIQERHIEQQCTNIKYINMLQLQERQVNYKAMNAKYNIQGYVLYVDRMLGREKQLQLYYMLMRMMQKCKVLELWVQESRFQVLVRKVFSFIALWLNKHRKKLKNQIFINQIDVNRLFNYRNKEANSEHFKVIDNQKEIEITYSHQLYRQRNHQYPLQHSFDLDLFNFTFHQLINAYPQALLHVNIRNNRNLGKEVISLLQQFGCNRIKSLDFRNCLFSYEEVQEQLYLFPFLQRVNDGEYVIKLNKYNLSQQRLMKLLKFFLKMSLNGNVRLTIHVSYLEHKELTFSILTEIIIHFKQQLTSLDISFQNIPFQEESFSFWRSIFQLQVVKGLCLRYWRDLSVGQSEVRSICEEWGGLRKMNVQCLKVEVNMLSVQELLNVRNLRQLSLNFSEININEATLCKILKPASQLQRLTLILHNNTLLNNVHKLSDTLHTLNTLTSLHLHLQNCPIKQNSLYELIEQLEDNSLLQCIELNINYCNFNRQELVKILGKLSSKLKMCHMIIYAAQQPTNATIDYHSTVSIDSQLLLSGIQLYF